MCFGRSKNVSCIERNTSQPVSNLRGYTNSSAHPSSPPASEHHKWCQWNMIRTSADLVRCLKFSLACIDLTENPHFSNISLSICLQTYQITGVLYFAVILFRINKLWQGFCHLLPVPGDAVPMHLLVLKKPEKKYDSYRQDNRIQKLA